MENTTCPRCGSKLINNDICIKCGEIINKSVPYKVRSRDYASENHPYDSQKKYRVKACSNCGRVKWNVGDNLCGACKAQVYNPPKSIYLIKGTEEYEQALIIYREKRWPEKFRNGEVITAATLAQGKRANFSASAA
jgi:hypothetical protein